MRHVNEKPSGNTDTHIGKNDIMLSLIKYIATMQMPISTYRLGSVTTSTKQATTRKMRSKPESQDDGGVEG